MDDAISDNETTVVFVRLDGHPQKPFQTVEDITRPWVNGVALRKRGIRGEPYTLRGITNAATAGVADSALNTLASYPGRICTVILSGVTYVNLACTGMRVLRRFQAVNVQGGVVTNGKWIIEVELDFVYGGV